MVGNDIIDVSLAMKASHWRRDRFLEKLFTPKEQSYIFQSEHQEAMLWQLWSMKESAYKLYMQKGGSRFYNPKRIECQMEMSNTTASIEEFNCKLRTTHTSD
ncbi:MAG: 4'-phosphopantetheinyl transferase superfamily protein, partial [Bacteroidota bacterium]